MILATMMLLLAAQEPSAQPMLVPADGQRHKLVYKGDTFKIERTGTQIAVERMRKVFRNNNGPAVRLLMKKVAREVSGCDLKDEYFTFYTFTLEATLACPPDGKAGA